MATDFDSAGGAATAAFKPLSRLELCKLSALELASYLGEFGVSVEGREKMVDDNISGRALLLLDDNDLKEVLKAIGDRAIVKDLLSRQNEVNCLIHNA